MKSALLIASATALSFASAAHATRWTVVANDAGRSYAVDLDAINFDGAVAAIWLKIDLPTPEKKGAASAVEKWLFDCENDRAKLLAQTVYKANGSVLTSGQIAHYDQAWQPSSVSQKTTLIHQAICNRTESGTDQKSQPTI